MNYKAKGYGYLLLTDQTDLISTPIFKCRNRQTPRDRIHQVYPTPANSCSALGEKKRRRRRKQESQKCRKLFLRRKTTLPFPEQSISHTDILLLLYLPNPNLPMIHFQLHSCHMVLSFSHNTQGNLSRGQSLEITTH